MPGHLLIGAVEIGFVAASAGDAGLSIVGNDQPRTAARNSKVRTCAPSQFPILARSGFGIGVVAGAQDGDKDRGRMIRSALRVMDGDRVPGVIHEKLFARLVLVAEHNVQMTVPAMVELTEAAVAVAVGVALAVFLPEQLQRQVTIGLQFLVKARKVGRGPMGFVDPTRACPNSNSSSRASSQPSGSGQVTPAAWAAFQIF